MVLWFESVPLMTYFILEYTYSDTGRNVLMIVSALHNRCPMIILKVVESGSVEMSSPTIRQFESHLNTTSATFNLIVTTVFVTEM